MHRLNAIPKAERCGLCAGFGRVFGLVGTSEVRYRKCRGCGGTGRRGSRK